MANRIANGVSACDMKAVPESKIQQAVAEAIRLQQAGDMQDIAAPAEYDDLCTRHMVKCVTVGKSGIFVQLKEPDERYE